MPSHCIAGYNLYRVTYVFEQMPGREYQKLVVAASFDEAKKECSGSGVKITRIRAVEFDISMVIPEKYMPRSIDGFER